VIQVPEAVIRAIAAAPQSHIRDLTLAAMGLDAEFNSVPESDRQAAQEELAQVVGEPAEEVELPF